MTACIRIVLLLASSVSISACTLASGDGNDKDPQPQVATGVDSEESEQILFVVPPEDAAFDDLIVESQGMPCGANVICVDAAGGADFASIQAAIDAAQDGQVVQVAAARYDENVSILDKQITFLGGFESGSDFTVRDPASNLTIISALEETGSTLTLRNSGDTAVDGFYIIGGGGSDDQAGFEGSGAGILIIGGSPLITQNVVQFNQTLSGAGGGIYVIDARATITRNLISRNLAALGGGIAVQSLETVVIEENIIDRNSSRNSTGYAGGLYLEGTDIRLNRNLVVGNVATNLDLSANPLGDGPSLGGGVVIRGAASFLSTSYNRITENFAVDFGSAVFVDDGAQAVFFGDLIYNNRCASEASTFYIDGEPGGFGALVDMVNITALVGDCASNIGGQLIFAEGGSALSVRNSILLGDGQNDFYVCDQTDITAGQCFGGGEGQDEISTLSMTYSLNDEGFDGEGNFIGDPLFVNPDDADHHLQNGSPAIDAADPSDDVLFEPQPNGARRNLGTYGGTVEATSSLR